MESVQLSHSGSTTHSSSIPGMFSPDRSSHVNSSGSIADDQVQRAPNREERFTSWVADHRLDLEQRILGDRAGRRESRLPGRPAPSHSSLRDAAASQYAPRGPYVPIEMQSAAAGSSGEARSHARSGRDSHGAHPPPDPEDLRCRQSFVSRLKEKRLRRRLITLVISACFLILVIAIYLAFAASRTTLGRELQILLIFMILILGIVFCHSLTRFLMALLRRPDSDVATNRIPSRAGPAGYAQPARPIHVILAGDEDVGAASPNAVREKVTAPPPAYGLWRESVRINPDLLYWQRIENSNAKGVGRHGSNKSRIPRPPSYTSDNGVDYVIEAQPRSFTQWRIPEEPGHQS